MDFPQLLTSRLFLRKLTEQDTPAIFNHFADESVVKYYDLTAFTEQTQATDLINFFNKRFDEGVGIRWAICLKESDKVIGTCGFNSWNAAMKNAVIGYDLMPEYWGNGYITEAVGEILKLGFSGRLHCGELFRVQADTIPGNIASEKVLIKLGFREEGIRRSAGFWKEQFHDLKCFGLLKSDLPSFN